MLKIKKLEEFFYSYVRIKFTSNIKTLERKLTTYFNPRRQPEQGGRVQFKSVNYAFRIAP